VCVSVCVFLCEQEEEDEETKKQLNNKKKNDERRSRRIHIYIYIIPNIGGC
jgi:hypothetical protein